MKRVPRHWLSLTPLIMVLVACASRERPVVGTPNPASVHCEQLGGESEIRTDPDGGQYGVCRLPDGRVCEEWALFREDKCVSAKREG